MKTTLISLLLSSLLLAQYCEEDNRLIETTYQRAFNKDLIQTYLSSNDPEKVRSALLSISHSEDTSFIPLITSLPFNEYAELICFAVGQIGPCVQSGSFLWNKIHSDALADNSRFLFEALGKTGWEKDLEKITEMYSNIDAIKFPYSGISLAIMHFAFRGIRSNAAQQMLIDEVNNPFNSIQNKNDALFTLARTRSSDQINEELINILKLSPSDNLDTIKCKQFALMNFRTQNYFPEEEILMKRLLGENNTLLLIEAARTLCYMKMNEQNELESYVNLVNSDNHNISRAAASSIKFLNIEDEKLLRLLKEMLENKFSSLSLSDHTRGELFISYTSLFKARPESVLHESLVSQNIPLQYWAQHLSSYPDDNRSLSELLVRYKNSDVLKDRISILTNLLNFQKFFSDSEELYKVILNSLSSEDAPLVSIAADGMDSTFIFKDKDAVVKRIKSVVNDQLNNPEFIEGVMSLVSLAERVDNKLFSEILVELKESKLYSLKKFVADKSGEKVDREKSVTKLGEFLGYAFKYKSALIKTEKGNFVIEFLPDYAPISVGNFCKLASNGFFNGIIFHRVVPGFVIQCGDPTSTGWGGPGYEIVSEFSPLSYDVGMVGMASAGKDTEGSQWFVMQGNYPHLNGRYSLFGKVADGMEVVYNIDQDDKILSIILNP